jgi:rhomboid family GlyGly-CTERM serine protease
MAGEMGREGLRYDRVWIVHGELWRLISGHFAHLSWSHLLLNCTGLLLVWFLVGSSHTLRSWAIIIATTLLTIDLAFWLLNPDLYWYVGMSGLLHGLLSAGIVARLNPIDTETLVLMLLVIAKIGWEQFAGPVPGSALTSGGPVVVDAHLYGAIGGILGALVTRIRVKAPAAI